MSKRRTDPATEWASMRMVLQPDATYEPCSNKLWCMDDVARDKWSLQVTARAWQLLCLWNKLDPDPLGFSAEDLHHQLQAHLAAGKRAADLEKLLLDTIKLPKATLRKDPLERLRQLSANLNLLGSSIARGALKHQCSVGCEHDANARLSISDFLVWAEQSRLPRCCDWPPRSLRRPDGRATYVRLPVLNRVLRLTVAVAEHFEHEYTLVSGKVPTYEEIASYLRTEYGELSDRLVRQVAANLRPDEVRPGPRGRR